MNMMNHISRVMCNNFQHADGTAGGFLRLKRTYVYTIVQGTSTESTFL